MEIGGATDHVPVSPNSFFMRLCQDISHTLISMPFAMLVLAQRPLNMHSRECMGVPVKLIFFVACLITVSNLEKGTIYKRNFPIHHDCAYMHLLEVSPSRGICMPTMSSSRIPKILIGVMQQRTVTTTHTSAS